MLVKAHEGGDATLLWAGQEVRGHALDLEEVREIERRESVDLGPPEGRG